MRGRLQWTTVVMACCLAGAGCSDSDAPPNVDDLYPTTIQALPPDSLETLQSEYADANPHFCSGLDRFGFSNDLCSGGPGTAPELGDTAAMVARVGQVLVDNSRFTGVSDLASLHLEFASRSASTLRLRFAPQVLEGLPVEHSSIDVTVGSVGVRGISGHHCPAVHIPIPRLTGEAAKFRLVHQELTWADFGGRPQTFIVTAASMPEPATRVILPVEGSEELALRVAWRILVAGGPGWHVFVDTVTGAILETRQLGIS